MMTTRRRTAGSLVPPLAALAVLLVVWHVAHIYGPWRPDLFPGPLDVAPALAHLVTSGQLGPALYATMRRLLLGFGGSLLIGLAIGFLMARFDPLHRALKPYLLGLQSLPGLAWVPLSVLWFGFTENFYVFVTLIGSLFAAALMFTDAIAAVPAGYLNVAQTMGARGVVLVSTVAIPAALPSMVSAVKQTWSFAWRSLIGAEIILLTVGLGFLLSQGREFGDIPQVMAVMLVTLFVGVLFEVVLFAGAERWVQKRWGLLKPR